jgi:hypothetical protein
LFKGIEYSVSTNIPSGAEFPNHHVVHALRIDLSDPDIRLLTTPRLENYVEGSSEVGGLTVSDFLRTHHLQAAINANFFDHPDYYLPAGTPMDLYGLAISEGVVVSPEDQPQFSASIVFDAANHAEIVHTNWPPISTDGITTAVTGEYSVLINGVNAGYDVPDHGFIHQTNPRTAFGLSQDRRYLFIVAIDGRQPGYSNGAYDYETGGWLLLLGAYDGINMDGGGSTTLVVSSTTGIPVRLNRSSAVADSGRERTVGSHFGIYAKPLPGFINDVIVTSDDTSAKIAWTTVEAATSEIQFGATIELGSVSDVQTDYATTHEVKLSGLTPKTGYYFRAVSATPTESHLSPLLYFTTTNYVTTNRIFEVTNSWKYTTSASAGSDWASNNYDDSGWGGPGPGLLWADVHPGGVHPRS